MKMTKTYAKEVLDIWKVHSPVYRGVMTAGGLVSYLETAKTLDGKPLLSQTDVLVIVMALKLAGAKIG